MSERKLHSNESAVFTGRIGEVIHTEQPDGRIFERYRRPPGTRLIIVSPEGKILLTKEHRQETDNVDLRVPGGKVRDSLEEYHQLLDSGADMLAAASEAAIAEGVQETGHIVRDPTLVTVAGAGATVEWDLYYFLADDYEENPSGQELELGEDIELAWLSTTEIREAISRGEMQEMRSVGVLLGMVIPQIEARFQNLAS